MIIHHLNCATQCVVGGRFVSGEGSLTRRVPLVCHCLLIETNSGLVLVDTGLGLRDVEQKEERLGRGFMLLAQPRLDPDETAVCQIERLGFSANDVRHIIVTHLDLDHAGGLSDFPLAKVHLLDAEWAAATKPTTFIDRYRYHQKQWEHDPHWVRYAPQGEQWKGFECVRQLEGLPPEILLVPLAGHTHGHTGVAVYTQGSWLLHAGDAYYFRGEMNLRQPHCPIGLSLVQRIGAVDDSARRLNQQLLRQLMHEHAGEVCIFCAHDPVEFERYMADKSTIN
ncbi:MAG TPA: MBL fold metallo-hydrolase [Coleofasciculaceae cyanobacterium]|jgi:glyoxylase-like metal-dependent hydrolase (beta-lactamase superfamily II)